MATIVFMPFHWGVGLNPTFALAACCATAVAVCGKLSISNCPSASLFKLPDLTGSDETITIMPTDAALLTPRALE
jgi:hypothetical protein